MVMLLFGKLLMCISLLHIINIPGTIAAAGQKLVLNDKEQAVNAQIKELKYDTLEDIETNNLYKSHFYECKEKIQDSQLFQIIKKMPKAASLDGNFFGLISHEYLYNLTYLSGLYIRISGDTVRFSYAESNTTEWQHLRTLRRSRKISESMIKQQFSFQVGDFANYTAYATKLTNMFNTVKTLLSRISVMKAVLYRMLQEFYEDNIMYVEFRYSLDFYDTKIHRKYRPVQVLKICNRIIKRFKKAHPGFFGAKIIYSPVNQKKLDENLQNLLQMISAHPKALVGFDVKVDDLDVGRIMSELRKIPIAIQIFLHFGKDVSFKNGTNLNLINAMVNRPSRYIHSNKLLKNKQFYKHIKGLGVGIGILPLSLVRGSLLKLRSHSSVRHIKENYRILVGSDYPGFLESSGVSYDWYLLFIFMTDLEADLSFLKQIALDSLIYSGLQELDAMTAISIWTERWYRFIETMQH